MTRRVVACMTLMPLDPVEPGSRTRLCGDCGTEVTATPAQQELLRDAEPVCLPCAPKLLALPDVQFAVPEAALDDVRRSLQRGAA